jgi:hypothetical protein
MPSAGAARIQPELSASNLITAPGPGSSTTQNGLVASSQFQLAGANTEGGTLRLFDADPILDVAFNNPMAMGGSQVVNSTVSPPTRAAGAPGLGGLSLASWSPGGFGGGPGDPGSRGGADGGGSGIPNGTDPIIPPLDSLTDCVISEGETCPVDIGPADIGNLALSDEFARLDFESDPVFSLLAVSEPAGPATIGGLLLLASMYLKRHRRRS